MTIHSKTLDALSNIIEEDFSLQNESAFYKNILKNLEKEVPSLASGVYFLDDVRFSKKSFEIFSSDKISLKNYFFKEDKNQDFLAFLNSKNEKTFTLSLSEISPFVDDNVILAESFDFCFLVSKLLIKGSLFGFSIFVKDAPFSEDEISVLNLEMSIYSYVIKDFELNKVFKTQLSLLQDAISDRESACKTIEKQNKKLIQADNAKTSFLANVSHELRTPLNAIIGFSDVLINEIFGKLNEKQMEYIKDINRSSIHLMGLINSLLDFSKIESGSVKLNLSDFTPKTPTNEVINLLCPLLGAKEIEISYIDETKTNMRADYQKFQQILFNLIGNAIKFSPQKGKILVRTTEDEEYFILEVEDFGIGIEKKYHNYIFKKFTQIDNIYTKTSASTGLGLAITKEYVKLHKGKIYVISKPGLGSTFVVKFKK